MKKGLILVSVLALAAFGTSIGLSATALVKSNSVSSVQGPKGDKGDTGAQGEKGDKGDKGDAGAQGEKGDKGDTGAQGEKGDKGDKGDAGAQGEKGDKGDAGAQGPKGDKGDTGAQGEKGDKGDKGDAGAQGEKGDKGDAGAQGPKGDKGDTGAQGEKGDKGDKGDAGAQGEKGDKGDTSYSSTILPVSSGYITVNKGSAVVGEDVVFTYVPDKAGDVLEWNVNANGKEVSDADNNLLDNKFTAKMVEGGFVVGGDIYAETPAKITNVSSNEEFAAALQNSALVEGWNLIQVSKDVTLPDTIGQTTEPDSGKNVWIRGTDSNVKVAIDKGKTLNSAARIENVTLEITGSNLTKAIELGDEALNVTLSKVNIEIAQGASFRDTGRLFYFGIGNGGKAEFELDNVNIDKSLTDAIPNVFETKSADGQLKTVTVNNSVISGEMIGTFNRFGNGFKFVSNNSTLNVGLGNAFLVSNSLLENNTASFDFNNTVFTKVAIQYTVSSFNGGIVRFEKNEGTDATLSDFSNVSVSFNNSKTIVKDVTNDISINSNLTTVIPSAATKGRYDANLNATGIVGVHQTKDVITDNGYSADSAVYPDVFVNGNQVSFEKLVKAN